MRTTFVLSLGLLLVVIAGSCGVLAQEGAKTPTAGASGATAATTAPSPTSQAASKPQAASRPQSTRPAAKAEWVDPNHEAPNGTLYKTFASKVLGHDVSYLIYLPAEYDQQPSKRYPVIYWLHGYNGNQRGGATVFVPYVAAAIKDGTLPPVIVVLVNGMARGHYLDSPNGQFPIESVIIKDLIPHVDQTYRTIATRQGRVIEGFSMGGFGAGHLGFKFPDLFGTVIINSGALREAEWFDQKEHPKQLAAKNVDKVKQQHIRIACGTLDDLLPNNRDLHETLTKLGIEHQYMEVPDVPHDSRKFYKTLGAKAFEIHRKVFESLGKSN